MSQNLRNYLIAVSGFEHTLRSVPANAWDNPSPCDGWTTKDVAGHAMAVINNVAARAGVGDEMPPFGDRPGDVAGDDPVATWYGVRGRLLEALDRAGALQIEIKSSAGTMALDDFVGMMVGDAYIHTWDLARAAGIDERLDPTLIPVVMASLEARGASIRAPGRHAEAGSVSGDVDAQTRLLVFTGRKP
jgi:uncharacterized protein (TIGR03086 family)